MNALGNFVIGIIIILAIMLILLPGSLEAYVKGRPPDIPSLLIITNNPGTSDIKIEPPIGSEQKEWPLIDVVFQAEFTARIHEDVGVIPIVSFKGVDKIGEFVNHGQVLLIKEGTSEIEGTIRATNIVTEEYPVRCGTMGVDNVLKAGETLIFSDRLLGTNYTLKLVETGFYKGTSISDKIANRNRCGGSFFMECYEIAHYFDLFSKCQFREDRECSLPVSICNNTVYVTGIDMDCDAGQTLVEVYFEENPNPYTEVFETGERVGITFFRDTDCVRNFPHNIEELKDLLIYCEDDFMGGRYEFTGPIAVPLHQCG